MDDSKSARYAGLVSWVLAAVALMAGVWLAAAHPVPVEAVQPAEPVEDVQNSETAQYARAWETQPAKICDGLIPYPIGSSQSGGYAVANSLVKPADIYKLPSQGPLTWWVPENRCAYSKVEDAEWLQPDDLVYGIRLHGKARCYPRNILARHCVVNDELAGEQIVVYYDPLSKASAAFVRPTKHVDDSCFRAIGYGYGGIALLSDIETNSLWDILGTPALMPGTAITGKAAEDGVRLSLVHGEWMTFGAWVELWPSTSVMSVTPAEQADGGPSEYTYETDPYTHVVGPDGETLNYYQSDLIVAPKTLKEPGSLKGKEEVLGVRLSDGTGLAIPVAEAFDASEEETQFTMSVVPGQITLTVDPHSQRMRVVVEGNVIPPQTRVFWFAWYAHYPNSAIWHVDEDD